MVPAVTADPPRQARSRRTHERLLEAALVEFAAHGYDGASTRAIAARAGVHQPQINQRFGGKDELWRAAVDHLFAGLDAATAAVGTDPRDQLRAFVGFAADRPELNRIMVQEAGTTSERLAWMVERHVRDRFEVIAAAVGDGIFRVAGTTDPMVAFYLLVGAASLLYVNAAEARLLTGRDPRSPEVRAAHTEAVVALALGATGEEH